ncbi:MAG: hypothetical protein GC200_01505 [Tepidisphaera sp.]|nr:hypothetical protein [Tepidisphaera sp.]
MPLPPTACCRKCYYPLTGAAPGRCPECGREFDPSDPKSYLAKPPSKWKWPRRIAAVLLVLGLGYAFRPTGYVRCDLRIVEADERGELFTRYTLLPPRWLGDVTYPHWTFHERHDDERMATTAAAQDPTFSNYLEDRSSGRGGNYVGLSAVFREWDGSNASSLGLFHTVEKEQTTTINTLWCMPSQASAILTYASRRSTNASWGSVNFGWIVVPRQ